MLTRLLLKHFQCHRKLVLDLDPLVTSIVGTNDVGKSAVLRALRLLMLNPQTAWEKLVTWGEKECLVRLELDGHTISRRRGKSVNSYKLDGKEYVAMGPGVVPDPVAKVLLVGPTTFQRQADPHFWFSDTSGQVSRRLNEIINLSAIDRTLANLSALVRRTKTEKEVSLDRLKQAKQEAAGLEWVPKFDAGLKVVEEAETAYRQKSHYVASLAELLSAGRKCQGRKESVLNAKAGGKKVVSVGARLDETRGQVESLKGLTDELRRCQQVMSRPVPDDVDRLVAFREEGDSVAERRRNLGILVESLREAKEKSCEAKERLEEAKVGLGKVCPVCGQSLQRSSRSRSGTSTSTSKPHRHGPSSVG